MAIKDLACGIPEPMYVVSVFLLGLLFVLARWMILLRLKLIHPRVFDGLGRPPFLDSIHTATWRSVDEFFGTSGFKELGDNVLVVSWYAASLFMYLTFAGMMGAVLLEFYCV